MEVLKKKIVSKPLVLRVENNKTFEVADFDAEVFLNKLKKKKTKVAEHIKVQKEVGVDLLHTVPAHLFEAEEAKISDKDITAEYLNINTPYRGVLLYHGLGGQACASVAVAESLNAKSVHVLTPQGRFFKDQIRKCGGDIDKFRFSAFAMDASANPFENGVVVIDEAHRFDIGDPKVKRVYEWIVATPCRVVALSAPIVNNPNQLGVILNMVRGGVKMFRVEKDWSQVAATVQSHKDEAGACVLVRNPPGYVNVMEEGKIVGVKRGDYLSDAEFEEKTGATVTVVDPFPKDFSKLSEEGFKKRAGGLVAFFRTNPGKVNPVVIHLVKGSKSKAAATNLGKRSLVFTQGFKDFKEELEKFGYLPLGKKIVPKTYVEYEQDEEGEKKRLVFQKSKIPVLLSTCPDVDVDVTDVHMAEVDYFEELCSRKKEVTPHVYLSSGVDAVVKDADFEAKTVDEKKFKTYRAMKEDAKKWVECLREVAVDCNLHGMRCYSNTAS